MSKYVICGMEKLSLVDYDKKLSATLFSNGCNFECSFCHNSSLVHSQDVVELKEEEYLEYLEKRKKTLDAVVITGGEPTLMPDLEERIIKIKENGLLVKLDTNGSNYNTLKKLIEKKLIDYVAMDIKNSYEQYFNTIGISFNKNIIENIKKSIDLLKQNNIDYEFRTTLVEELHNEESIEQLGRLIEGSNKLFLQKFIDRGTCIKNGLHEVDIKKALEYKCLLEKYVKHVELRGY